MKVPNNMPSHKQGGIKGIIKGSKQPIEFEGGEEFFSKDHVKTMENYMRKGNTSALGKFVMEKMKDHRSDGFMKTYLKDGDVLKSSEIPAEDLAYIDQIIDFELSHGSKYGTGLTYGGWSGQKVTDRESARLFIYNTIATKYSDYPIEIRKRAVDMELNSEDPRGSLLVAAGIITPDEKGDLYNVINPKTGNGMMNPKELDELWNKHKDEAMSKINESGFAETFDDEKHRSYGGYGQMYEKSQKYRIDMWDSNRENFVAPDEYKNFDYDGGSPTIGKKSFSNTTSTKPATSSLAKGTQQTSALAQQQPQQQPQQEESQEAKPQSNRSAKGVLDMIGKAESDPVGGYNAVVRSEKGDDALTGMTLTEIEEKYGDIAVGRYQIIGETRRGLIENLDINPDTFVYNEENQDFLATELLKEKGLDKWLNGEMDNDAFLGEIATVWRGLPMDKSGKGFEEGDQFGNSATISYDEAIAFMGVEETKQENSLRPESFTLYDAKTDKSYPIKIKYNKDGSYKYSIRMSKKDGSVKDIRFKEGSQERKNMDMAVESFLRGSNDFKEGQDAEGGANYNIYGTSWFTSDLPVYNRMTPEQKDQMNQLSEQKRIINQKESRKLLDEIEEEQFEEKLLFDASPLKAEYEKAEEEYQLAKKEHDQDLSEIKRLKDAIDEIESNWDLTDNANKAKLAEAQELRKQYEAAKVKALESRDKFRQQFYAPDDNRSGTIYEGKKLEYDEYLRSKRQERDVQIIEDKRKGLKAEINKLPENSTRRKKLETDYDEMGFALEDLMGVMGSDIGTYGTKRIEWVEEGTGVDRRNQEGSAQDRVNMYKNYTLEDAGIVSKEEPSIDEINSQINSIIDQPVSIQTLPTSTIYGKKSEDTNVKADLVDQDEIDVTTVDNETLEKQHNSKEKIDKLGLRGLVEKYGGVDMALQASGMIAGYMAASGDVPIQQKSALWQERMSQLRDRTQLGLDNKSKTLLQRQAERTYASDVTNIGRMAPSGQSALGALGTASARKYDADLKMGAIDADMRNKNEEIYQSALAQDEALTQQLYKTNVVDEAKRQRDVDTKFILEGANRLQEARQYQQMYGKGSLYEKFKESQIEDLEASREAKKASRDYYTSELAKNQ